MSYSRITYSPGMGCSTCAMGAADVGLLEKIAASPDDYIVTAPNGARAVKAEYRPTVVDTLDSYTKVQVKAQTPTTIVVEISPNLAGSLFSSPWLKPYISQGFVLVADTQSDLPKPAVLSNDPKAIQFSTTADQGMVIVAGDEQTIQQALTVPGQSGPEPVPGPAPAPGPTPGTDPGPAPKPAPTEPVPPPEERWSPAMTAGVVVLGGVGLYLLTKKQ